MTTDLFTLAPPPDPKGLCGGCGKVHADAREVTLVDGTKASNYSEAWRVECEARGILDLPELYHRQKRLEQIEKRHGKKAADQLRAIMTAIWNAARADKSAA